VCKYFNQKQNIWLLFMGLYLQLQNKQKKGMLQKQLTLANEACCSENPRDNARCGN